MAKTGAILLVLGAVGLLAGCAQTTGAQRPSAQLPTSTAPIAGVVCPPDGTVAVRNDVLRVRYAGADPADPATCLLRNPDGSTQRLIGGLISTHPVNDAERRAAIAGLFPMALGKTTQVSYSLVSALVPHPQFFPFEESFRVSGEGRFDLNGANRPTWVVDSVLRSQIDPQANYDMRYVVDQQTGVVLAFNMTSRTGANLFARPYRVTELELPGQP